jgi:transcriptional regulator with XRE-family HTH domain
MANSETLQPSESLKSSKPPYIYPSTTSEESRLTKMLINLRSGLLLRGVRQYRLARMVEISEPLLSMLIAGRRKASKPLQRKIAKALACDETWLFQEAVTIPGDSRRGSPRQAERNQQEARA